MNLYKLQAFVLLWLFSTRALSSDYNLRQGVTDVSHEVYELHMTIFLICCVIGIIVFSVMFWALIHHRKSKGAEPAQFHESTKVEIFWTAVPFLILVVMAIPATKTLIAMEDTSKSDLTIKVTGSQWKWHYEYMGHDVDFFSVLSTPREQINNQETKQEHYLLEVDKPLVIPTDRKVRFLLTSDDVIHSWWVPDFAVKKDANPGFINEAWTRVNEEGLYRGQCAELCGKDHGFMPIVVDARNPEAFELWLAEAKQAKQQAAAAEAASATTTLSKEALMAEGERVYMAYCAACHQPTGMGLPGVFPAMKGSPVVNGELKAHIDILVNGRPGTAMQAFGKQLTLTEIAGVITYKRNSWGNETGEVIQPGQIQAFIDATEEKE
ncbi:cytochrome c oxidase subunit II [Pseudoalteromonas sp. SMS1]|uniref:cytochrome c oxidase subunit II n=1 Tax=Pseudoalteromonas sp. SMS1 TaxID=2908894 RepID=UPI001F1A3AF2|nr:cytochrome c oxidase subunit II [Pseudoalteromonas sp. SMS1]MCF2859635.1 cytochrome c oxidase subunit II [Pseudoalteromonas sp. SMS1]